MRDRADRWIAAVASVLLLACLVHVVYARGGPYFARPETIVDHVDVTKHIAHDAQILVERVRKQLPDGATVACITPVNGKPVYGIAEMLTAVGRLPDQNVVASYAIEDPRRPIPEYVIAMGTSFDDPRYHVVAEFTEGRLYRVTR